MSFLQLIGIGEQGHNKHRLCKTIARHCAQDQDETESGADLYNGLHLRLEGDAMAFVADYGGEQVHISWPVISISQLGQFRDSTSCV